MLCIGNEIMGLLMSCKRVWLLPYILVTTMVFVLYFCGIKSIATKTIIILTVEMQSLMLVFFIFVLICKWKRQCRLILSVLYIVGAIYLSVNKIIGKWYVIVPISVVLLVYMLWNLGGIINCIVADKYKKQLCMALDNTQRYYYEYKEKVLEYNSRNQLSFWSKVPVQNEPNWYRLAFNSSGIEMFDIIKALVGVYTAGWEIKISELNRINESLKDKHGVLDGNNMLFKEKKAIERISNKSDEIKQKTETFSAKEEIVNKKILNNRKAERKILKRKW